MTGNEWINAFAAEVGADAPSPDDIDRLLALGGTAAHASERTAAPIACWLAATAQVSPQRALEIAERLRLSSACCRRVPGDVLCRLVLAS